jgi:hypothetical protein
MANRPILRTSCPRIGHFWFIAKDRNPSRFVGVSRPLSSIVAKDGVKRLAQDHAALWPILQQMDEKLRPYDYAYFPRGHVEWREDEARYVYLLDAKLNRGAFVAPIVLDWKTPRQRLAIYSILQYRSIACVGPPKAANVT